MTVALPEVTPFTGRLYGRLPELYRDADAPLPGTHPLGLVDRAYGDGTYGSGTYGGPIPGDVTASGLYPLLRYISLIGDQAGAVEAIIDRIDYTAPADGGAVGDTSDLTDPDRADRRWLPWLAQLRGARIPYGLAEDDERAIIRAAAGGFDAGSRGALIAAARKALTGTRYVNVIAALDGDRWTIGLSTLTAETPDAVAVVDAIEDAGAKPAGFILEVTFYSASWDTIEAIGGDGSWDHIEALGSWSRVEAELA